MAGQPAAAGDRRSAASLQPPMSAAYITTTIPYVNARPHIGQPLELVQADGLTRYRRGCGEPVRFQSGTDDISRKNVLAAQAAGPAAEFVDGNAEAFLALGDARPPSVDDFIRTGRADHRSVHAGRRHDPPGAIPGGPPSVRAGAGWTVAR